MNKYRERFENAIDEINAQAHAKKEQELFVIATELVIESQRASISYLQRTFNIGYNRAANLLEKLEHEKIVSAPEYNGQRSVLIS